MKYMIEYKRTQGITYDQSLANEEALLVAFSKWSLEEGLTVHAHVGKLSANGGYVLVEAKDPKAVVGFVGKFSYWVDSTVVPVMDVGEAIPVGYAAIAWAKSVMKS